MRVGSCFLVQVLTRILEAKLYLYWHHEFRVVKFEVQTLE